MKLIILFCLCSCSNYQIEPRYSEEYSENTVEWLLNESDNNKKEKPIITPTLKGCNYSCAGH